MNRTILLACVFTLAAILALPGTVAAAGDEVGVCVIGVESPCNGDDVDGDGVPANGSSDEPIQFHIDELPYASGLADEDAPVDADDAAEPVVRDAPVTPDEPVDVDDTGDDEPIQFHPDELPYASGPSDEPSGDAGDEQDDTSDEESDDADAPPGFFMGILQAVVGFLAGLF